MGIISRVKMGLINQENIKKVDFQKFKYVIDNAGMKIANNNILNKYSLDELEKFAYPFSDEHITIYEKEIGLDIESTEEIVRRMK